MRPTKHSSLPQPDNLPFKHGGHHSSHTQNVALDQGLPAVPAGRPAAFR